ncbi:hypothetical protein DU976_05110 [Vibrio navarrensis]|uniref:Uncharacterized protein n=1 Tax=Vibrio navarrensis TaxID=29495 RepID=A0AAI9G775_9VIBR|nr:hypothetical protein [Vibrio navarrensis]EGR2795260.1 hypothetical protein [Vibrio navarrensis]EJL6566113.1 hypothetical protein [Vibrio navarrensis]ELN6931072.1 hypothetical protein [Vibrio navarrensis]
MYNLSVDEISMVDGGGDGAGALVTEALKRIVAEEVVRAGLSYMNNLLGGNNNYNDNSGVGIGTNQSYGGYGQDSGGGMMQAGGSKGRHGF